MFILLFLCGFISVAAIWRKTKWEPGSRTWDMLMSATFAFGLLLAPYLFIYDLMLLLLPLGIVWSYYIGGTKGRALDGGSLLCCSALLYIICFIGSLITLGQLKLCTFIGVPKCAIQLSVFVILGWSYVVIYDSKRGNISEETHLPFLRH